jgi:hypothetical protein
MIECEQSKGFAKVECLSRVGERADVVACQRAARFYPGPECFSAVARATQKVEVCDQIAELQGRVDCIKGIASGTKDPKPCDHISAPGDRDDCVTFVADRASDVTICDRVTNPVRRDNCRRQQEYFQGRACHFLEDTVRKDACYLANVIGFQGTIDLCERVEMRRPTCLLYFAKGLPEICERMGSRPDSLPRRHCYDVVFKDRKSCAGVPEGQVRAECERRLAGRASDSATCAGLRNGEDADDCWNSVARADGALCLQIKNVDYQRDCLKRNWPKAKDGNICSRLTPAYLSQFCASRFGPNVGSKPQR